VSANLRLDLLQLAIVAQIREALPAGSPVNWTAQVPAPPASASLPFATLNILAGPSHVHRGGVQGKSMNLPDTVTLTVTAATVGARCFVRINGVSYWEDVVAGDTTMTVRNRLLATFQGVGGVGDDVDAVASGGSAIVLTPGSPGAIWDLKVLGPISGAVGDLVPYKVTESQRRVTVTIQVFSRATVIYQGALFHMSNIVAALERPDVAQSFADRGIAIWGRGPVVPVTALVGTTTWESRAAIDVDFALRSVIVQPVGTIGRADVTYQGTFSLDGPVVHTDSITVQEP
jgi:hypothetical protein